MSKKSDQTLSERIVEIIRRKGRDLTDWVRIDEPNADRAQVVANAELLSERTSLAEMLPLVDLSEDGVMVLDTVSGIRLGFMIEYQPFLVTGVDAEPQVESLITSVAEPGAVIQFGVWASKYVKPTMDAWKKNRRNSENEAVASIADNRAKFFVAAAHKFSLASGRGYAPRLHRYFVTVTLPFNGREDSDSEWEEAIDSMSRRRDAIVGNMRGMGLHSEQLNRKGVRQVLRGLMNPHIAPEILNNDEETLNGETDLVSGLVDREHRLRVSSAGHLHFKASDHPNEERQRYVTCLTVDGFPQRNFLPLTNFLIKGHPAKGSERISQEFYAYLNIQIQDGDAAADRLSIKLAGVSRQLVSDSPAYRALMSHLFEQKDQLHDLIAMAKDGHHVVASYFGVNLLADSQRDADEAAYEVASFWKSYGFRTSPERFISLPVYLSSLPGYFHPGLDPVKKRGGIQRSSSMSTYQAALLAPVEGDWHGTPPEKGGLMLLSRRGQPAAINVQDKEASANYNFTVVAGSGSGKSFLAQEIIMDFLARGGYVFVIDAGRSYFELAETVGGTNLVFNPEDPLDLNPFATITDERRLKATIEMLKELFRFMAFPNTANGGIPDWQEAVLEHAIEAAWHEKKNKAWVGDVAEWLAQHEDPRAQDIATQLRAYTHGRLADWFNGNGRKVDLHGKFVVIEMDDLKGQGSFRNVALSMMMQRIADAMYAGGDSSIPKLMLIDEAWDLLASNEAGDFIERAYRTYRKYGGSAGVITQSFADFNRSKAAEAAYTNSSWLFSLRQKPESLEAAFRDGRVHADEQLKKILQSVNTVQGEYSEVFVRCDSGQGVFRFVVDPSTYWLFTTGPTDKAKRKQIMDSYLEQNPGMSRNEALKLAVEQLAAETTRKRYGSDPDTILNRIADSVIGPAYAQAVAEEGAAA